MKNLTLKIILIGILFYSCNQMKDKSEVDKNLTSIEDKENIQILISKLYEWHETKNSNKDFIPIADKKDSNYIKLDQEQFNLRLIELKKTNFFDSTFLANYTKIWLKIDANLKNKTLEWFVGEIPSFGNDANPWCNCQDYPYENYWQKIILKNFKMINQSASFSWTWGDNFEYKVRAIKENNDWKISYLQGFDFNSILPRNEQ